MNSISKIPKGFTFSQSSLQEYSDCPRRYQLHYLERLRWPAVDSEPILENEKHQLEGQIFHRLIQENLLGLPTQQLSRLANTSNLDHWWKNFQSSNLDFYDYAHYTELTLSAPIGAHRLLAKYDLVAIKLEQKILIFDWKTYKKRPYDEWMASRWQTRVYRSILIKSGAHLNNNHFIKPEQIEMIYWYADFPSEPAHFTYDTRQFNRDWSSIEKLVSEISSASEFPMTKDENTCRFCSYRSYCGRGKKAGILEEAETELESDSIFDVNFEQIGEVEF